MTGPNEAYRVSNVQTPRTYTSIIEQNRVMGAMELQLQEASIGSYLLVSRRGRGGEEASGAILVLPYNSQELA